MIGFDQMWQALQSALGERQVVTEFRMNDETRRQLVSSLESRMAMDMGTPSAPVTAFGIPVMVDSTVPTGMILPIVSGGWPELREYSFGFVPSPDESHGMTIDELLDNIDDVLTDHRLG